MGEPVSGNPRGQHRSGIRSCRGLRGITGLRIGGDNANAAILQKLSNSINTQRVGIQAGPEKTDIGIWQEQNRNRIREPPIVCACLAGLTR